CSLDSCVVHYSPTTAFYTLSLHDALPIYRLLGTVATFQDPWHPAVLRLVAEVGRAGEAAGKSVGICGEAAADPALAVVLVGLGRSEEHTSELQSLAYLVCRLLLEKKKVKS